MSETTGRATTSPHDRCQRTDHRRAPVTRAAWRMFAGATPVLLIFIAASALRFLLLGSRELFRDEAASWLLASYPWTEILPRAAAEPYAPVYAYILKAWIALVGDGPAALRALSAASGVGVVAITWAWARESLGPRVALVAASLVAISPLAIANARDVRMYSMETLFITLAWWLLWRLVTDTRPLSARPVSVLVAAAAVAAELWTLPTGAGAFLLQATAVGLLLARAPSAGGRAGAAALIVGLVAFLPGVQRLLSGAGGPQPFWTPIPNLGDLPETLVIAFAWQDISPAWLAVLPLALLAGIGFWWLFGRGREALPIAFCVAGGAALILVWWTVSLWRSAYDTRYLAAVIPPLAIAIAAGWERVVSRVASASVVARRATYASGVALLLLLAVGAGVFVAGWLGGSRLPPAEAAVAALRQRVQPGDVVVVADARSYLPVAYLAGRTVDPVRLVAPVRYWRSGLEPAFGGGDLVAAGQSIGPQDGLAPGKLPGLSANGSIWLLALTDPAGELAAFTPLHDGRLVELERFLIADNGVSGWMLRLRPAP